MLFLGNVPAVDLSGLEALEEMRDEAQRRGLAFRLAEAHGEVRGVLQREGFDRGGVPVLANQPVKAVLEEWAASKKA